MLTVKDRLCYRKASTSVEGTSNSNRYSDRKRKNFRKSDMTKRLRIVVFVSFLFALGCNPTQTRTKSLQGNNLSLQDYFPLRVGASWKYKIYSYITRRSKNFERKIIQQKGPKFLDNAKAVYSYDTYGLREGLRYLLKYPLKVGNRWLSVVGVTTIERYLITSVGRTVSVPAGTFKNCIVVRSRQKVDRQRSLEAMFYFAPKVGFIKITQTVEERGTRKPQFKLELTSYSLGSKPAAKKQPQPKPASPKPAPRKP